MSDNYKTDKWILKLIENYYDPQNFDLKIKYCSELEQLHKMGILVNSEDEESYKAMLNDIYKRGLASVDLIIHDGAGGIAAACNWVYPYTQHQRCVFHKQMNLIQNIRHQQNKSPKMN